MSFEKWEKCKLTDLGQLARGKSKHRPRDAAFLYGGKYPFVQTGDIKSANHRLQTFSQTYSEEGLKQSKLWPKDTLCITIAANIADTAVLNFPACFPDSVLGFIADKDKCDIDFIEYYLRFIKAEIRSHAIGSVQDNINLGAFEKLELRIPNPETQRRIAALLTALDDKIELNRRMNETLEGIAGAVWGEWFGQYAGGEELPEGVIKCRFDDHLDVERGLSYKGSGLVDSAEEGTPMYNLNSVLEGGGFKYAGMKYYSGEYKERHLVNPGELIVANTEQGHKYLLIGFPAVVPKMFGQGICSHHIYRVRTKPESYLTTQFFYYLMLQQVIREQIVGCANGTTVNMLKIDGLKVPEFYLPPEKLVQDFSILAQNIWDKQEENREESRTLTALRDALLPRLMSGALEL